MDTLTNTSPSIMNANTSNNTFTKILIAGAILLIIASFFLGRCSNEEKEPKTTEPITIEVPEQSGSTPVISNPQPLPSPGNGSIVYRDSIIKTENPFNKELAERYIALESDTAKLRAYLESIQTKDYEIPFEDDHVIITSKIKTQGDLLELKQDYTVKPYTLKTEVPVKKSVFAMYAGAELGSNARLDKLTMKGEIGLQVKGSTIYTVGMDTDKNFYAGVNIKIFDIKK